MVEIIVLWILCKRISSIARLRKREPANYCFLLVGLWIAGELIGLIVGVVLTGSANIIVYIFALVGAVIGSSIAFKRANRRSLDFPFNPPQNEEISN
jgi:hypothetical protein